MRLMESSFQNGIQVSEHYIIIIMNIQCHVMQCHATADFYASSLASLYRINNNNYPLWRIKYSCLSSSAFIVPNFIINSFDYRGFITSTAIV